VILGFCIGEKGRLYRAEGGKAAAFLCKARGLVPVVHFCNAIKKFEKIEDTAVYFEEPKLTPGYDASVQISN